MAAETPFQTGTDLTNYTGNANLAYGSGATAYNGNPAIQDPFAGVNDTLKTLQAQENARNDLRYSHAMKLQDEFMQTLAQTGGTTANAGTNAHGQDMSTPFLSQDMQDLSGRADSMRKFITSNPSNYQYQDKAKNDYITYMQLAQNASARSRYANDLKQQMVNASPDERKDMQDKLDQEVFQHSLREFHPLDPYRPKPTTPTYDRFIPADITTNEKYRIDYGGDISKDKTGKSWQNSYKAIDPSILDFRSELQQGTPKYKDAVTLVQNLQKHGDQSTLKTMYDNANNYNQAYKLAPDNAHYMQPTVVQTKDENGNPVYSIDPNASLTNLAYNMVSGGKGSVQPKSAPYDETMADIKYKQALTTKAYKDSQGDDDDKKISMVNANTAADQTHKVWSESNTNSAWGKAPLVSAIQAHNVQTGTNNKDASAIMSTATLNDVLKNQVGLNAENYKAIDVPLTPDVAMMGGKPLTTNAEGQKIAGTSPEIPIKVWHIKDPNAKTKDYFVYQYSGGTDKDNKQLTPQYEVMTKEQMAQNYNMAMNSFKPKSQTEPATARQIFEKKYGSENSTPIEGANVAAPQQQQAAQTQRIVPPNVPKGVNLQYSAGGLPNYKDANGVVHIYFDNKWITKDK